MAIFRHLNDNISKNLILFVISAIVSFLMLEIVVRGFYKFFASYHTEVFRYAAEIKKPLDDTDLPFHHFTSKRGQYYGVEIKTNSNGFRDREYSLAKPEKMNRIIVLGDSVVLGWGVPFELTFSEILEKKLNAEEERFEVINLGTGNYNSIMQAELFKKKGLAFNPDLVILNYFVNDAEPTPKISRASYLLRKNSYLYAFISGKYLDFVSQFEEGLNLENYYRRLYREDADNLLANKQALEGLISLTSEKGIRLMIVSFPDLRKLENYPFGYVTEHIESIAGRNDVLFLDLLPAFEVYKSHSLWVSEEDSHPNIKAHEIAGEVLYEKLLEENVVDGKKSSEK